MSATSPAPTKPEALPSAGRPPRTKENISNEIVLGCLREVAPRPQTVPELADASLKNYATPLSVSAVGSALRRLAKRGLVELAPPIYYQGGRPAQRWVFVGEIRAAVDHATEVSCIAPLSATEERSRACLERLIEELDWGLKVQRLRPPPYKAGVLEWLDRSDVLLKDCRALLLELTNRKLASAKGSR